MKLIQRQKKPLEGETWNKIVGGLRKYQIRDYYKRIYPTILKPQLDNHYVFFRAVHGPGEGWTDIMRHYPGQPDKFIHIKSWSDLWEWIRLHAIEIIPELAEIGDPERVNFLFIELDVRDITGPMLLDVIKMMVTEGLLKAVNKEGLKFHTPLEVRDTGGRSIHIYLHLKEKISFDKAREIMKEYVISDLARRYPELVETNIQMLKERNRYIFPDISSLKVHGGARAVGSIHAKTHLICKRIILNDVRKIDFRKRDLITLRGKK